MNPFGRCGNWPLFRAASSKVSAWTWCQKLLFFFFPVTCKSVRVNSCFRQNFRPLSRALWQGIDSGNNVKPAGRVLKNRDVGWVNSKTIIGLGLGFTQTMAKAPVVFGCSIFFKCRSGSHLGSVTRFLISEGKLFSSKFCCNLNHWCLPRPQADRDNWSTSSTSSSEGLAWTCWHEIVYYWLKIGTS